MCKFVSWCSHRLYHSPDLLHKPHRKVFPLDTDVIVPYDKRVLTMKTRIAALDVLLVGLGMRIEAFGDLFTRKHADDDDDTLPQHTHAEKFWEKKTVAASPNNSENFETVTA